LKSLFYKRPVPLPPESLLLRAWQAARVEKLEDDFAIRWWATLRARVERVVELDCKPQESREPCCVPRYSRVSDLTV